MIAENLEYIKIGGTTLLIVIWYLRFEKPRQSRIDEKRELDNKNLIEYFIKAMREDNKNALSAINDNLTNLYQIINDKKHLDNHQIELLLKIFISNSILKILNKINFIIDNNNLIKNEDEILRDIKFLIDKHIQESKETLHLFDIPDFQISKFIESVKTLKISTFERIDEYFTTTVYNLASIDEELKIIDYEIKATDNLSEKLKIMASKGEKIILKEDDYSKLKRNINSVLEAAEYELHSQIKDMT